MDWTPDWFLVQPIELAGLGLVHLTGEGIDSRFNSSTAVELVITKYIFNII